MGFIDGVKQRLHNSWHLTVLSARVLMQDKELLLFPILSTISAVLLFIGIVVPSILIPAFATTEATGVYWGGLILWYFSMSFTTIFFNAALIACVKKRLGGGDPTVMYGIKEAGKRIVPIIVWSLISTTVGIILRAIASNKDEGIAGAISHIVASILGFAWTIITMFVLPIIVIEQQGVFASMKRSAGLIKKTWGEQIVMTTGIGLVFSWVYIAIAVLGALTWLVLPFLLIPIIIGVVACWALAAVVQSALSGIFHAALYSYAAGDNLPVELRNAAEAAFEKKQN
jgi:hypothetical protein